MSDTNRLSHYEMVAVGPAAATAIVVHARAATTCPL